MQLKLLMLVRTMGISYVAFRLWHEILRFTGAMKFMYGTSPGRTKVISVIEFSKQAAPFLPLEFSRIPYSDADRNALLGEYRQIISGEYPFFSGQFLRTGHADWLTNPLTGYTYDVSTHWSRIKDIDPAAGDIKFVWERARFSWVYTLLRADRVLGKDSLRFLIDSMLSFIRHSPVNCGPHWRCGQEISLRVLNWISILYFYRDRLAGLVTDVEFSTIIVSIHDQMQHVYRNRHFARIAVRNNHAITEALGLYATGLLFSCFRGSRQWQRDGKCTLEREALFQIYPDGAYLQHSFTYQRIVVQLFTFAVSLGRRYDERFSDRFKERLTKMLTFLTTMQDQTTGTMPNYGANDGAFFFPVGRGGYRDFRPQIDALCAALSGEHAYNEGVWYDETAWFYGNEVRPSAFREKKTKAFTNGGYFYLHGETSWAMVRCAAYRHRPSHADQLHIDIWDNGCNIARDCGSYTYDMSDPLFNFFTGTQSHNTVRIANSEQMAQGPRFIWYNWPNDGTGKIEEQQTTVSFCGETSVYKHLRPDGIRHQRTITMHKAGFHVEVIDVITPIQDPAVQIWNVTERFHEQYILTSFDKDGTEIPEEIRDASYSETYGVFRATKQIQVPLKNGYLHTIIRRRDGNV